MKPLYAVIPIYRLWWGIALDKILFSAQKDYYRIRLNYRTVRQGFSKLQGKLVVKYAYIY